MSTPMRRLTLTVCAGALLWFPGCSQKTDPNAGATPVSSQPAVPSREALAAFADQAVKDKATELAGQLNKRGSFPRDVRKVKENAPAFLYLAAMAEDKKVRMAALKQIRYSYSSFKTSDTQYQADQNYDKLILHYLKFGDPEELHYALGSAAKCVREEGDPAVLDELFVLGNTHANASVRHKALRAISSVRDKSGNERVADLFLKAFDDEALVSTAALNRSMAFGNSAKGDEFKAAFLKGLESKDPSVRGDSIYILGHEFREPDFIIEKVTPLLKDESSYVRARALETLGWTPDPRMYDLAASLLDDQAEFGYELKFKNSFGEEDVVKSTNYWKRVDQVAVDIIAKNSDSLEKEAAKFKPGEDVRTPEGIAREVEAARKWLAARK